MIDQMRRLYRKMERIAVDGGPMTGERMLLLRELMLKRDELAPKVGEPAPDFDLPVLYGEGERVRLSALRGRPVALIFGSYT